MAKNSVLLLCVLVISITTASKQFAAQRYLSSYPGRTRIGLGKSKTKMQEHEGDVCTSPSPSCGQRVEEQVEEQLLWRRVSFQQWR